MIVAAAPPASTAPNLDEAVVRVERLVKRYDTEAWRFLPLLLPTLALGALGTWAFGRRDVAAA